jgi:hypothetical protein
VPRQGARRFTVRWSATARVRCNGRLGAVNGSASSAVVPV